MQGAPRATTLSTRAAQTKSRTLPGLLPAAGCAGIGALAIGSLCWRLGSSSLFIDEVASWRAADASIGELFHRVRVDEVAPPTYYLLLHVWVRILGSDREWVMRSLSVVAAVAMVGAVYWLASMLAGRLAGSLAALLAAVSPLVLEYGQEVRAYAWAMLAVTIAAGCIVRATREEHARSSAGSVWLALGTLAGVLALWFHYSAILVIGPLAVFACLARGVSPRLRLAHGATIALGGLALLPILRDQLHEGHQNAIAPIAQLTASNVERVVGAPFDRTYNLLPGAVSVLAALLVLASIAILLLPRARGVIAHPRLIACLAGLPAVALIVLTAAGRPELISRYDAVAVPFMVIAIGVGVAVWGPAGLLLTTLALVVAVPANFAARHRDHAYPDTRAAVAVVARNWHGREVVLPGNGYPALPYNLQYYAQHLLPRKAFVVYSGGLSVLQAAVRDRAIGTIALITDASRSLDELTQSFRRLHFHVDAAEPIRGSIPMQTLVVTR